MNKILKEIDAAWVRPKLAEATAARAKALAYGQHGDLKVLKTKPKQKIPR